MGYIYELSNYYKIKDNLWPGYDDQFKIYPWPCEDDPDRNIRIYDNDIFTINSEEDGICDVTKHTGLCCLGILIPRDDLEEYHDTIELGVNV